MELDVFLCDFASVREGLLHVLGAGITRLGRPQYPAPMGISLAGILRLRPSEAEEMHRLRIVVRDEDGKKVAELGGEFGIAPGQGLKPGEMLAMPIVLPLQGVAIPRPGTYGVDVLLDSLNVRSLSFVAEQTKPAQSPPTEPNG